MTVGDGGQATAERVPGTFSPNDVMDRRFMPTTEKTQ